MISAKTARLINCLPEKMVVFLTRWTVNKYLKKYANLRVKGQENLKNITTPTLFICNHLSNSDGLILDKVLKDIDPTFVAGVKLSKSDLSSMAISIIKTTDIKPNTADKEGLKRIIKLIRDGESILIFPEGTRSRTGSLIEAKKGVLLIARMTGAPVVPIGIWGTDQLMPINKKGDMNAEKFHHANVHVNIGEQYTIPKKQKDQKKQDYDQGILNLLMGSIAELLPESYQGVYKK